MGVHTSSPEVRASPTIASTLESSAGVFCCTEGSSRSTKLSRESCWSTITVYFGGEFEDIFKHSKPVPQCVHVMLRQRVCAHYNNSLVIVW